MSDMGLWWAGKAARAIGEAAGDGSDGPVPVGACGGVFAIGAGVAEAIFARC